MGLVYGLIDPRDGALRYVGKTTGTLARRLRAHLRERAKTHKVHWIAALRKEDKSPEIIELDRVADADLNEAECFWIGYLRFVGCNLTNATIGGDGQPGLRHSEKTKQRISAAMKARRLSPEHRRRIGAAQRGRRQTDAMKEKIRKTIVGQRSRAIVDQNGTVYESQAAAARALGLCIGNVNHVLKGRTKSTMGYVFRYVEEPCSS